MIPRRKQASQEAEQKFAADQALAARFDDLLAEARSAEQELRGAEGTSAPLTERYRLAKRLDTALTDVMRAAYAAERVAIGPLGYDDRIYRRKAKATLAGPGLVRRGRAAAHAARESPADRHSPGPAERGHRRIG